MMRATVNGIASKLLVIGAGSARLVAADAANDLLDKVARIHVSDACTRYWWSSLKHQAEATEYGSDTASWRHAFDRHVQKMGGEEDELLLAITDDEDRPWPVIAVAKDRLLNLLLELPFFEYFVFEKSCNHVVFDTHHNTLVASRS